MTAEEQRKEKVKLAFEALQEALGAFSYDYHIERVNDHLHDIRLLLIECGVKLS